MAVSSFYFTIITFLRPSFVLARGTEVRICRSSSEIWQKREAKRLASFSITNQGTRGFVLSLVGGCFGVGRIHEQRSLEKESRGFSLGSLYHDDWHQWSEVVNREPFVDVPKFTLIWRNSHWLTNIEQAVLWLVWNVASLIPSANSIELFCRPDKFHLPTHASCIFILFKLHEIDRKLKSNPWSRLCLWKLPQKVSVQLLLYLAFSFKWPWIKAYSRTTFLTAFPSGGRLSCGTIAFSASIRLFVPLQNNEEKKQSWQTILCL